MVNNLHNVITKTRKIQQVTHPVHKEIKRNNSLNNFMSDLKSKMSYFPETSSTKRLKVCRLHVGIEFKQLWSTICTTASSHLKSLNTNKKDHDI
jgi:hypothetical protein